MPLKLDQIFSVLYLFYSYFKMRSIPATVLFQAIASLALASPSPSSSSPLSQCISQMDGSLPYYVPKGFNFSGNVRQYYVAVEIETWNYAPSGTTPFSLLLRLLA
jgi:hypothetical protein